MNTLLSEIAAIVAPIMSQSEDVGECIFTDVNSTQVSGTYNGYRIVLSRVWDNNDHHVRLWWSARCDQHSFIHHELSQMLSEILEQQHVTEETAERARLNQMYAIQAAKVETSAEVDDDQDWFI